MTRNEQQLYSDVTSIRESLKKIANALETNVPTTPKPKDIPGFEGTLDALDVLCDIKTITDEYALHNNLGTSNKDLHDLKLHTDEGESCDDDHVHNDYLNDLITEMTLEQYADFHSENSLSFSLNDAVAMTNYIYELEYEECLGAVKKAQHIIGEPTSDNPDPAGYSKAMQDIYDRFSSLHSTEDEYEYEYDLQGIRVDSDHDIRSTAHSYEAAIDEDLHTKKDCILDYVTNEFGLHGARYTDIIKFAYYLGEPNALKYSNANRGYYSCAFNTRFGGHLIKGGKDFLVKGINNEGNERYFAHSSVDNFTGFYKRIA